MYEVFEYRKTGSKQGRIKYGHLVDKSVFRITFDKKTIFSTNPMGAAVGCDYRDAIGIEVNADGYWEEEKRLGDIAKLKHIKETGYVYVGDAIYYIHKYLNTESIEECLVGDNYFLYMLAIMDRRVGKRIVATIEEILPYCNQLR